MLTLKTPTKRRSLIPFAFLVSEVSELFDKKAVVDVPVVAKGNKSMLSLQLEQMKEPQHNPFHEYVKHDGKVCWVQRNLLNGRVCLLSGLIIFCLVT